MVLFRFVFEGFSVHCLPDKFGDATALPDTNLLLSSSALGTALERKSFGTDRACDTNSDTFVVKSGHCRGEPEQLLLRKIVTYPYRKALPWKLQLGKRARKLLKPCVDPRLHVRALHPS